jgi:hypothetical protein
VADRWWPCWLPASRPDRRHTQELCLNACLESTGSQHSLLLDVSADLVHSILPDGFMKQGAIGSTTPFNGYAQLCILVVGVNEPVKLTFRVGTIAGPDVITRRQHHCGTNGIEFDRAVAGQQLALAVDQARLVATLPKRAAAPIGRIEVANITPTKRLHGPCDRAGDLRRHQQMYMVGQWHVGVNATATCQRRLTQLTQVALVVLLPKETRLAIVPPPDDMLRNPRQIQTSLTWHDGLLRSSERHHSHRPNEAPPSAQTTITRCL